MPKPLQEITVLAADDSSLNLMIITQVLLDAGAKVITATNGREVLEKLEELEADIVLMDLQMPELDGFQTAMVIRHCGQQYSNIPIIAVTAETDPSEIEKTIAAGMNDFILKPFVPQVIHQKILFLLQTLAEEKNVPANNIAATAPNFNLTYLNEITNGDKDNLAIFINNLAENAPILLSNAIIEIQLENWADAASHLHKLKGLISLFFMPAITDAILIVEKETKKAIPNKTIINREINFISINLPANIQSILNIF